MDNLPLVSTHVAVHFCSPHGYRKELWALATGGLSWPRLRSSWAVRPFGVVVTLSIGGLRGDYWCKKIFFAIQSHYKRNNFKSMNFPEYHKQNDSLYCI